MSQFDSFAVLDWSGGKDTGPRPRRDAIWLGLVQSGRAAAPRYFRNRAEAEEALLALMRGEAAAGRRLLLGVDFPLGYPAGFGRALTGSDDPFALWEWLEARIEDSPQGNNRFALAGQINRQLGGPGPFWGSLGAGAEGLSRTKAAPGPFAARRATERALPGTFTCWQLAGAGSVGGQVLTGLPVLARLRRAMGAALSVWPFQAPETPVVLAEIWPSLINPAVTRAEAAGEIRDAAQVRLLAQALSRLPAADLAAIFASAGPEAAAEGWVLGAGHAEALLDAAQAPLAPPPLRDDCFALPPGVEWTPVQDALDHLRSRLHAVAPVIRRPLFEACGQVLAEPVTATRSNPPHPNSAVDGYGFAAAALSGPGPYQLPLAEGRAAAGAPFQGSLPKGQALRVLTGAALPEGVDTVVLEEDVTADAGHIAFRGPVKPGANTRRAGEDFAQGDTVLQAERRLTPADLALAAAAGQGTLALRAPLRAAVLSTGDELREPGTTLAEGQIHDANRPMLLGLLARWGMDPVDMGRSPDDREALRARLDEAASQAQVILTSGGASAGDEDHVSALLRETGALSQWRIAIKPGRPLALGLWKGTPVFGLPGNPVAALVCALIFARPALALLQGEGWHAPQRFTVPANFTKSKKPGRSEYLRARIRDGRAETFASEGSGRISGLSWAEGLVELPSKAAKIAPGDPVTYIPYASFDA